MRGIKVDKKISYVVRIKFDESINYK